MACLAFICASQSFRCDGPKPVPIFDWVCANPFPSHLLFHMGFHMHRSYSSHDINVVSSALDLPKVQ
jgi:hypothetical protein